MHYFTHIKSSLRQNLEGNLPDGPAHDAMRTPELPAGEDAFDEHAAVPIVRCSSVCVTRRLPWSEEGQEGEAAALASGRMVHVRSA